MHVEAAGGVFAAEARDDEMAGPNFHQIAAIGQAVERCVQLGARGAAGAEFTDQLLEGGARVRQPRDVFQNGGVSHLHQL